jgi:hypothetical protein
MARKPHPCHCSPTCEATTLRSFAPGHDAKMARRVAALVVSGSLDQHQAADAVLQAGGSWALVRKMLDRVALAPVAWTRVTDVTILSERDALVVQYYGSRAERGVEPWVLHRADLIGDEPHLAPENEAMRVQRMREYGDPHANDAYFPRAFWSPEEAVTWQATACQGKTRGNATHFHVWHPRGIEIRISPDEKWDPTK